MKRELPKAKHYWILTVLILLLAFSACSSNKNEELDENINNSLAEIQNVQQNTDEPLKKYSFSSEEDFVNLSDEDVIFIVDHDYRTADFIADFNADSYVDFGTPLRDNESYQPLLLSPSGVRSDYDVNKRMSDEDFYKLVKDYFNDYSQNGDKVEIIYYGETNNYAEYGYKTSWVYGLERMCFFRNTFMMSDTVDGYYYGGPYYLGELTTDNILLEEDFYLSTFDNSCILYREVEEREDAVVYIYYYPNKKTFRESWKPDEGNNQKAEIWKNEVYFDKETHRETNENTLIRSVEIPDTPMHIVEPE